MRVEVRAVGLREMRRKRGLTQRQLARDLGISQNYIPAIEANDRQPGPNQTAVNALLRLRL
jgi:transcriptional regulator with XRE-family HTH domain